MDVIGEYKGKPTPDLYANMLNQVGREFNNAMLVVENNSIGYTVLDNYKKQAIQTSTTQPSLHTNMLNNIWQSRDHL